MPGARQTWLRHRLAVLLMPAAIVAVHQLRFLLAFGSGAQRQLLLSGDGYVDALLPGLALLVAAAGALAAIALRRAARGEPPLAARRVTAPRLWVLWALAWLALLTGYLAQEALEVLLGSADVSVFTQAFAHGGWWAVPAASLVALAWALAVRGSRAVLAFAVRRARRTRGHRAGSLHLVPKHHLASPFRPPADPLARRLAGRAPPVFAS